MLETQNRGTDHFRQKIMSRHFLKIVLVVTSTGFIATTALAQFSVDPNPLHPSVTVGDNKVEQKPGNPALTIQTREKGPLADAANKGSEILNKPAETAKQQTAAAAKAAGDGISHLGNEIWNGVSHFANEAWKFITFDSLKHKAEQAAQDFMQWLHHLLAQIELWGGLGLAAVILVTAALSAGLTRLFSRRAPRRRIRNA